MEYNNINDLLERYWKGETTLEEEASLRSYYTVGEGAGLEDETARMFRYFALEKSKGMPEGSIDLEKAISKASFKKMHTMPWIYNSMRIAAGLVVLLVAFWFIRSEVRTENPPIVTDTYSDPKQAFEETKKALMMISKSFDQAEQQAKKINLFNEAQQELKKKKELKKM